MKTIKIGNQEWTSENLTTDVFRDGTYMEQAETWEEWEQFGKDKVPAWCYYDKDNDGEYDDGDNVFEKFYNWYAVTDSRGLAPEGWHIPTIEEWEELINCLGGKEKCMEKIISQEGLDIIFYGMIFDDGGARAFDNSASFWSATEDDEYNGLDFTVTKEKITMWGGYKEEGRNIRCVRN
jgi:uncharacterized protein (TIGR02145 family)|tara:strand:- start:47 stop:583 length:537 start_codon:yes stop_codon:yes gene_type:complete